MSVYLNHRATEEALRYFLDRHRENLMKQENERRKTLKEVNINGNIYKEIK